MGLEEAFVVSEFCFFTVPGHSRLVMWFLFMVVVIVVMMVMLLLVGLSGVLEGRWLIVRVAMTFVALCQRGKREKQDEKKKSKGNRLFVGLLRDGNRCRSLHCEVGGELN